MQYPIDHSAVAERENKLLVRVAVGVGCLLALCLAIACVTALLALYWTLKGQLGPGGDESLLPGAAILLLSFLQ